MKEELLWGLLNFHCFLAASITLASSWANPEISHEESFGLHDHSCKVRFFFPHFQRGFLHSSSRSAVISSLPLYFLIYPYMLLSPLPLQCCSPMSSSAQAASHFGHEPLPWYQRISSAGISRTPWTPPKGAWMQKCSHYHLEERFLRAQKTRWHFSYLETNIFLS